ncbi:MAG: class E sortase [Streptosporangiaceae bacterium]|nr:class E sortase [Streptosporangiaceae bacterium]
MRQTLRVTGESLLTIGAVILLFVAYLLWGSALRAASAQRQFTNELNEQWLHGPHPGSATRGDIIHMLPERFSVATGQPFAFIRIPAFGQDWRFTVIQGTDLAQLNVSPGHVPGTGWPGQRGNFAVAGHRVTSGNPFWSLPSLKDGDLIYIQTRLNDFTYRVTGKRWVSPSDLSVLDAVPGHPGQPPAKRLITLITCDPAWTGTYRVIVSGVLIAARPR